MKKLSGLGRDSKEKWVVAKIKRVSWVEVYFLVWVLSTGEDIPAGFSFLDLSETPPIRRGVLCAICMSKDDIDHDLPVPRPLL